MPEQPGRYHREEETDREHEKAVLKANSVGLSVNDLAEIVKGARFMNRRWHACFVEDPTDAGDHLAAGGIVGTLCRREDIAVIVRPDFEKHDPGVEAERTAQLPAEIYRAATRI